ncbi:MAG: GumC family protein [Limisphaerales bacterium]
MKPPETISIGARQVEPPPNRFRPSDIFYILFRHKWKILFFSLSGFAAGAYLFLTQKPVYASEARLLIRYVQETRSVGPMDTSDAIKSPDSRGENILNSEMDLITSLDLAEEVAATVGPSNVVDTTALNYPVLAAASVIRSGISVDSPRKSNVLRLSFRHRDPTTTRTVLSNLVAGYLRMHARVHRAVGVLDDLGRQAELRRADLEKVEAQLRQLKDSLGIASLEEAKRANSDQLARIKQELFSTESELAEARAALGYHATNLVTSSTNSPTEPAPAAPVIPREKLGSYESLLTQIDALKKRKQDLLLQYTEDSVFVSTVNDRIDKLDQDRLNLESANPGISTYAAALTPRASFPGGAQTAPVDRTLEIARVAGLEARWSTLQRQLAQLQTEQATLNAKDPDITELERKRTSFEKDYRYYSSAVEEARVEAALTSGRLANISIVQSASPPARDNKLLYQIVAGVVAAGLVLGFGLALGLEFYGDQTLRRPTQVSRNLNIPVFLTVPRMALPAKPLAPGRALPEATSEEGSNGAGVPALVDDSDEPISPLMSYAEALRDRVIMHFQLRELHHKPKLVGVTSCGKGAGSTTLATHLAASLSETGEGNVLYVDAHPDLGPSVQAFYRGKQATGVAAVLDQDARSTAKVNENFYMAALNETGLPGKVGVLPKKLANLLPKMKASDFDYIIFDLPPVTQTSATARVAGLLDMTLLVLESEKTHGDLARQVTGLLKQSRADVAGVLNKHRRYIPRGLDPDL